MPTLRPPSTTTSPRQHRRWLILSCLALTGCPSTPVTSAIDAATTDAGTSDSGRPDTGVADTGTGGCAASTVLCIDQSISMLDLFGTISPSLITEETAPAGEFLTLIDATGGGFMPTQSYVYARFTETGLEKVAISDEDAFVSSDWDISFRRFIIRLNSGVSGPSCVTAARTVGATTFDGLTAVPAGLTYRTEAYFTDSCDLVPDGSGLGSPASALSSYWTYDMCVQMAHNVYVVQTAAGRHVKLEVVGFYPPAIQATCDSTGMVPMPSMGGNVRIRWAFLD